MNIFCGTDIVKTSRIKDLLEKDDRFKEKIYSQREIEYCDVKNSVQRINHYAGRFAAKEAIYKAIPNAKEKIKSWKSIEIVGQKEIYQKPTVYIDGKICNNIDLSISHENEYAIAVCIYEKTN